MGALLSQWSCQSTWNTVDWFDISELDHEADWLRARLGAAMAWCAGVLSGSLAKCPNILLLLLYYFMAIIQDNVSASTSVNNCIIFNQSKLFVTRAMSCTRSNLRLE